MVSTIVSSLSSSGSPLIALRAFHPVLVITSYLFVRAVSTYLPTRFLVKREKMMMQGDFDVLLRDLSVEDFTRTQGLSTYRVI